MVRDRICRALLVPPPSQTQAHEHTTRFDTKQPGYPEVRYRAKPTVRGPSGAVIWGLSVVFVTVGFYRVGQTNIARRAEKEEVRRHH